MAAAVQAKKTCTGMPAAILEVDATRRRAFHTASTASSATECCEAGTVWRCSQPCKYDQKVRSTVMVVPCARRTAIGARVAALAAASIAVRAPLRQRDANESQIVSMRLACGVGFDASAAGSCRDADCAPILFSPPQHGSCGCRSCAAPVRRRKVAIAAHS